MTVRLIRPSDIPRLKLLAKYYDFPFPDLTNPLYFAKGVAANGDRIIGAGFLKLTAEAILILDYDSSKREKIEAINDLFIAAQMISKKRGIQDWHVFVKDSPNFENVLIKHYGFTPCKDQSGNVLHLAVE